MIFFPNKVHDNAGESAVWEELKVSLKDVDGFALNKANLYFEGKSWYQPDIIVASPHLGIILIEVKGCKIEDIDQVTLGSWSMNKSFYANEINPFDQVQKQKIRLINILKSEGIQLPTNTVKHCVALPFISKKEWEGKGFNKESIDRLIRFSDKKDARSTGQVGARISPETWSDICKIFGIKPMKNFDYEKRDQGLLEKPKNSSVNKGKLVCVPYKGYAPNKEMVVASLAHGVETGQINDSCTYLVATAGLERLRGRENPGAPEQKDKLLFDKAIEQMMNKRMLRKTDAIIILRRIIDSTFSNNEPRRQQLNADVYDLYNKMLELDSADIDLSNTYTRRHVEQFWTSQVSFNDFARLKGALTEALHDEHDAIGSSTKAISDWIKNEYVPHPIIFMEGFTRLTPIQKLYIDHCLSFGSTVVLLYSYDEKQKWGFSNQEHIVSAFKGESIEIHPFSKLPLEKNSDLNSLKHDLFDLNSIANTKNKLDNEDHHYRSEDGSVTATEYKFISQEVESVCSKIRALVATPSLAKKKVAIVTRDLGTYAPQFISKLQNDTELSRYLDLPQRKLLQTPFGRFILSLYKIWDHENERLFVDCDTFSDIIASGWFGEKLRKSLADFEFIKPLFSCCKTLKQWDQVLTKNYDGNSCNACRFPLASLDNRDELFKLWVKVLQHLNIVCERLFCKYQRNYDIAQHISLLGEELNLFLEYNPFTGTEKELLKQLKNVFKDLEKTDSISLSHQEFGTIINSMTTTEEQMEDQDERNWNQDKTQIKIVMPESIDGLMTNGLDGYDIIYYVGADNKRLPKKLAQDWLFESKKLLSDLEVNDPNKFERYLFLSVFRCAKEQFHLSYSQYDGSQSNGKSTYYTLLEKRLSPTAKLMNNSGKSQWDWKAEQRIKSDSLVKNVSVADMMVFKLCPYRYLLEKASNRTGCYKSEWQLTLYSGSQWKEGILDKASKSNGPISAELLDGFKDDVWTNFIAPYYPFISDLEMATRESFLKLSEVAEYKSVSRDKRSKNIRLQNGFNLQLPVDQLFWGQDSITEKNNAPFNTVFGNELLLPVAKGSNDEKDAAQIEAQLMFINVIRKAKNNMPAEDHDYLIDEIKEITSQSFKKRQGNHCKLCPSNKLCLPVNPEE